MMLEALDVGCVTFDTFGCRVDFYLNARAQALADIKLTKSKKLSNYM
jgi:hypothetical protein